MKRLSIIFLLLWLSACTPVEEMLPAELTPIPSTVTQSAAASPTPAEPTAPQLSADTNTPAPSFTPSQTPRSSPTPTFTSTPDFTPTLIPENAPTLVPIEVNFILHGDRTQPMVALTFDIGEFPETPAGYDQEIERVLIEMNAPATFFLSGHWMNRNWEITRRLAANPLFEIGNHSWSHADFRELESWEIASEIQDTNNLFYQLTGEQITLFRLPGGTYYPWVLGEIAQHGMLTIQWDLITADPVPDNDAENINRIVRERVQNGSIIIMHANGRGWHTAEALPQMIEWLREQGYQLVTISELLGLENHN